MVTFIVNPEEHELKRFKIFDDYSKGNLALTFDKLVVVFYVKMEDITYGLIAHEIYHLVNFMLSHLGLKYSEDSEEAYAYTTMYITDEFYKRFNKL